MKKAERSCNFLGIRNKVISLFHALFLFGLHVFRVTENGKQVSDKGETNG